MLVPYVLDEEPTTVELVGAIGALLSASAAGKDHIPPELLKFGRPAVVAELVKVFTACKHEGCVPRYFEDAACSPRIKTRMTALHL